MLLMRVRARKRARAGGGGGREGGRRQEKERQREGRFKVSCFGGRGPARAARPEILLRRRPEASKAIPGTTRAKRSAFARSFGDLALPDLMATASAADPRLKLGLAMLGEPVVFFSFLGFVWGFLPCGFTWCKEAGRVKVRGLQTFRLRLAPGAASTDRSSGGNVLRASPSWAKWVQTESARGCCHVRATGVLFCHASRTQVLALTCSVLPSIASEYENMVLNGTVVLQYVKHHGFPKWSVEVSNVQGCSF